MRSGFAALGKSLPKWSGRTYEQQIALVPRRSKVSDCFKDVYQWKNAGNRPLHNLDAAAGKNDIEAKLSLDTILHLERLSLVDFSNDAAVIRLSSAIRYADRLKDLDTTAVNPLFSLLEDETLALREDKVTEGNQLKDVLHNAEIVLEDFFVAPPGNVPLEQQAGSSYASVLGKE